MPLLPLSRGGTGARARTIRTLVPLCAAACLPVFPSTQVIDQVGGGSPRVPAADVGSASPDTAAPTLPHALIEVVTRRPFAWPDVGTDAEHRDVAAATGLHDLPPVYGRGTAMVDVDNDGLDDIWQSHARNDHLGRDRTSVIWRNLGDGTFAPDDLGIHSSDLQSNWGAAWGDIDNDGDPDVLLVNGGYDGAGKLVLYRNDLDTHGRFHNITSHAGFGRMMEAWWGASFADFDRDGLLDVVVTARSLDTISPCCFDQAPDDPGDYTAPLALYRNVGHDRFEDVSRGMGLEETVGDAKNPVWWDYDDDGWPDLFVANMGAYAHDHTLPEGTPSGVKLYRNNQGNGFVDVSEAVLPASVRNGPVFAASTADIDQDGRPDLYVGRSAFRDTVLFVVGDGTVRMPEDTYGLDMKEGLEHVENTMGLTVGDLTGDGFPDVFVGPGWPALQGPGLPYTHTGKGFKRLTMPAAERAYYHGASIGDLNQDGRVELYWNLGGFGPMDMNPRRFWDMLTPEERRFLDSRQQPLFLVGDPDLDDTSVTVRLQGSLSNRDAIGARITIEGAETRYASVPATDGFQSLDSRWIHLPLLGAETGHVTVHWPSGLVTRNEVRAGTRIRLIEPG